MGQFDDIHKDIRKLEKRVEAYGKKSKKLERDVAKLDKKPIWKKQPKKAKDWWE